MSIFCCRKIAGTSRTRKFWTLSSRFVGRGNDTCGTHRHDADGLGWDGDPNLGPFAAHLICSSCLSSGQGEAPPGWFLAAPRRFVGRPVGERVVGDARSD